jgi:hypothetical protein
MTPIEAKFEIDRQLIELAAGGPAPLVRDLRFFLYPGSRQSVLVCAERLDGGADIEASFELPLPVVGDHLDEDAVERMFLDVPRDARH